MVTLRLAVAITLLWAAPTTAGTVSGKLAPGTAKLPKSAKAGEAQVLALNIDTLAYGGASPVARNGRYSLEPARGQVGAAHVGRDTRQAVRRLHLGGDRDQGRPAAPQRCR